MNVSGLVKEVIKIEEDMFPKNFTYCVEAPFGMMFYNTQIKTSFESNHAVIYKDRINDLGAVLDMITDFYKIRGLQPSIYQSISDENYFLENSEIFEKHGYSTWTEEPARMMILSDDNQLESDRNLDIKEISNWDERIATDICLPANELHEIEVLKRCVYNPDSKVFVGYKEGKAVAIMHMHRSNFDCCRYDHLIVTPRQRKKGYAKEILTHVIDYCREEGVRNCFQRPNHRATEKIYSVAGFRHLFEAEIARASYTGWLEN